MGKVMFLHYSRAVDHPRTGKEDKSDVELWSGIRDEKKEALSRLFCLYYQQLFNYGNKIVPNEDFIKDCIQELFLTIWAQRKKINLANSVKSYLLSSMRRTVFRMLNKQRSRYKRNRKYIDDFFDDVFDVEELMIHFETKKEQEEQLSEAIQSLGKKQKEAIYLKFYEGMSSDEIALIMGIKRQSVYNHISGGIQKLQGFIHC